MTSPRTLLRAWNLQAKKQLGQHFLLDAALAEKIVAKAKIEPQDLVLEIGPGLGALTIPAARRAHSVIAVETDQRLIELLRTELLAKSLSNVTIISKSILRLDWDTLDIPSHQKLVVLGNLPYNISSQVLVQLINMRRRVDRAVLMFQKELAERLTAVPGGKDYGRLTVMLQYCATIHTVAVAGADRFFPKPGVESAVTLIRFKKDGFPDPDTDAFLFAVIKAAFSKRRKTLKNALSQSALQIDAATAGRALAQAEIDPTRRAETLHVAEFVRLAECLSATGGEK